MISLSEDSLKFGMNMTKEFEGFRDLPYFDSKGNLTLGYGRNLKAIRMSQDEGDLFFVNDYNRTIKELSEHTNNWDRLNEVRKMVLIDICFNTGLTKFLKFVKMRTAIECEDFKTAAQEIMSLNLADNRKKILSTYMRKGSI